jgi:hypothetical protein
MEIFENYIYGCGMSHTGPAAKSKGAWRCVITQQEIRIGKNVFFHQHLKN